MGDAERLRVVMTANATPLKTPAAGLEATEPRVTASQPSTRPSSNLQLNESEVAELQWTAGEGSPSMSRHARIILLRHEGRSLSEIAKALDIDRATVRRWSQRFQRERMRGLVHAS